MKVDILFATMTGTSADIANQTHILVSGALKGTGTEIGLHQFCDLPNTLVIENADLVLLVLPTYTDGLAPDEDQPFFNRETIGSHNFKKTKFVILSCGDDCYGDEFCTFAPKVKAWMELNGATEVAPIIVNNRMDPEAINEWYNQIPKVLSRV